MYILIINAMEEIKEMNKKKSNKKGFTIMEMLIVVAIIAVLAAIAIPTFNSALTKSKEAADVANVRAAYAQLQVAILTDDLASTGYASELEKTLGTGKANLNYPEKCDYANIATNGMIKYSAKKLTGKNSKPDGNGNNVFEWKVESPTIE